MAHFSRPTAAIAAVLLLGTAAAGAGGAAAPVLVVDTTFSIVTADPQRSFEPTGSIVDRAVYDTLVTYDGNKLARPIPLLARSYTSSRGGRTWTFALRHDVRFADGTPLTASDVVFSFRRLINLKARPSFLLRGIRVAAAGRYTVVLTSNDPAVAIPQIVASPSLGVLNAKLARSHGATDAADADRTDTAERWLVSADSAGAGSGPYVLAGYSTTSTITLARNARYWGARRPRWARIVVRNLAAPTQLLSVQRGRHEIAIDLSGDQAQTLRGKGNLSVALTPSPFVFFLFTNDDPAVSTTTSNRDFQRALRYGLDYPAIVRAAGAGAIQAPGMISSFISGALRQPDRVVRNVNVATTALAASGLGRPAVTLEFPSNLTINGVPFATIAQRVQANLAAVGIDVTLEGSPFTTWLQKYLTGRMAFGLVTRQLDYADPLNFAAYLPGDLVGARVGWPAGADPPLERLAARARRTVAPAARAALFRQIGLELNRSGPYFPLVEPTQAFVATRDVAGASFNAVYQVDVTRTAPR